MENDGELFIPIIIIGAGMSGIAAGCQLKEKLGFDQFRIFDRQAEPGGIWFSHRYPGVACDVPAPLYSYSFAPNSKWSTLKPSGAEILGYLTDVCRKYRICDHFQGNTEVTALQWDNDHEEWTAQATVYTDSQSPAKSPDRSNTRSVKIRAKAVISAVGKFSKPNTSGLERIAGVEDFKGPIVHTAHWDESIDLQGKDVIVVGTGCTAAQLIPKLVSPAINAASVTQLIRTPPWVAPELLSARGLYLWEKYMPWLMQHIPGVMFFVRLVIFGITESHFFRFFRVGGWAPLFRSQKAAQLLEYMKRTVPQKYHGMLTPLYEVGCKRLIHDAGWYRSLQDPRVQVLQMSLKRLHRNSVILQPPAERSDAQTPDEVSVSADAIILATGYNVQQYIPTLKIAGRNGVDLHALWEQRGGAHAYLGLAVDHFPNLYLLSGPNTSSGYTSVLLGIENNLQYILQLLRPLVNDEIKTCEVKHDACWRWTEKIQAVSEQSVWVKGGCRSWYIGDGKWNPTIYPFSHIYAMCSTWYPAWSDWSVVRTPKGERQRRTRFAICVLLLVLAAIYMLFYR
ncbi:hypothetical protein BDW42DRAFT_177169 [Aspergillus taichungensis]|uniref:Uncharacterized protein n=1 Tax=Aspergillus taichungensis TaxID=482145 RepID=A0A2J5HJJ2_9EURO|nr:hypothetical protein BDW42DRAFT_177169 [Aspergillus taichungensis]